MEATVLKFKNELFEELITQHGFREEQEVNDGQHYLVKFKSGLFTIEIEKYFREFYTTVYKNEDVENGVNLFNLLDFLSQGTNVAPADTYFRAEKDIDTSYKKQLKVISDKIYENFNSIKDFFGVNHLSNLDAFDKYWKGKHPELYR